MITAAHHADPIPAKTVRVDFADAAVTKSYDIIIGTNILAEAGNLIRTRFGMRRCVILSDANVAPLYQAQIEAVLTAAGHTILTRLVIPAGEASKNMAQLQQTLEHILAAEIDRKSLVIALGGGVVGDLAGLAAALVLRGLDIVQIPTTLLAQVDSSVGGKTGIDTAWGKNTIGVFYQPRLVLADVAILASLPDREMRAGYAETVKYGLIAEAEFFDWCCAHGAQVLARDHDALIHAVTTSCGAKATIVAADERESGVRALLNFGHTFGHALEQATGFGPLLVHGEAVAIGMVMATRLSVRLGLCPAAAEEKMRAHFTEIGLPLVPPLFAYDIDALMSFMAQDKKAEAGQLNLILTRGIGQAFMAKNVDAAQVCAVWKEFIQ